MCAFLAAEKAGNVLMPLGARAGVAEIEDLVDRSSAKALVTMATHRDEPVGSLVDGLRTGRPELAHHVIVEGKSTEASVTLDGSASSDADGDPLSFAWSIDGTSVGTQDVGRSQPRRSRQRGDARHRWPLGYHFRPIVAHKLRPPRKIVYWG